MRPILAATLVLLVAGSTVPPTAAETSRVEAVTSDPLYEAWIEALRQADARLQEAHAGAPSEPGCGATKLVQEVALFKHEARMRLLESLEKRGVQPGPPDDAVSAWPWGPGIGRPLELENETGNTAVLVDDGYIVYTNLRAQPEVDAVLAARAFYEVVR